jgi:hypothetical protein
MAYGFQDLIERLKNRRGLPPWIFDKIVVEERILGRHPC